MLLATVFGEITPPPAARRDPKAAADLVALMQRGERATFVADYVFTRSNGPGPVFSSDYSEARNRRFHVTRSGSSLDIDSANRHYDCELVDDQPSCSASPLVKTVPASEVLRIAVALGAYDVVATGDRDVNGEPTRCFQVRTRDENHALPVSDSRPTRVTRRTASAPTRECAPMSTSGGSPAGSSARSMRRRLPRS